MRKTKVGWVYFMYSPITVRAGHTYKIGKTNRQPLNRMAEIDLLLPVPLELDFAIYVDDMDRWETLFHKALESYNIRGEWFELHEDTRDNIIWALWGGKHRERNENDMLPSDAEEIICNMRDYYSELENSDVN